jgi:hypothetical protein
MAAGLNYGHLIKFMAKKAEIKKNISVNTEEPIEEKDIDAVALADEEGEEGEDGLEMDDDVVDPFGDKWEQ